VSSPGDDIEPCRLFFVLPDAMLRVLDEQAESSRRRAAALNLKALRLRSRALELRSSSPGALGKGARLRRSLSLPRSRVPS